MVRKKNIAKHLVCLVVLIFLFCSNAIAGINDGLVAYYPFNGNANDESGNGNNGTVHGALLTEDRFGHANSAYDFDGADDYISVADVPSLNFQSHDAMSISLWISWSEYQFVMHIIGKRFGCSYPNPLHYQMAHDAGGIQFGQEYPYAISAGISPPVGTWTCLVGLFDGNDYRFFMNGIQIAETTNATLGASTSAELKIGTSGGCDSERFKGSIDDVRIYNRALSEPEIQELCDLEFVDTDNDGIPNSSDNCPQTPNPSQINSDNDSHGDACDNCPNADNENQVDFDRDGIGDVCDENPHPSQIPTLSEWGTIIFMTIIMGIGVGFILRRKRL